MAVVWNIVQVEADSTTGAITTVHWEAFDYEVVDVNGLQTTHRGRRYGGEQFSPDLSAEGFTAWADVTEAQAMEWTKASLGSEKVSEIETSIASDIAESKLPSVRTDNPWDASGEE